MRVIKGNPAQDENFWPRPDVVDDLFHTLAVSRGSCRMFGLRRIGKTSILLEIEKRLLNQAAPPVIRIDVQGVSRFRDFLSKVFEKIPQNSKFEKSRQRIASNPMMKALLPALVQKFLGDSGAATANKDNFINEFAQSAAWEGDISVALADLGGVVLIIDELPFMLRNMLRKEYEVSDVERFLATLRDWRMNCGVSMLISGSLGLGQLSRLEKIHVADHIGDLFPISLPPLSKSDAAAMVEALARGEGVKNWTSELSSAVVDASAETWPIFLQYSFDAVWKSGVREPTKVREIVDAKNRIALNETFYTQFTTRLARYGADEKPARSVLRLIITRAPERVTFEELDKAMEEMSALEKRDDLLEALREDDFIIFDTEARTVWPASNLVTNWVRARSWGRA